MHSLSPILVTMSNKSLHFSEQFAISCGTVSVDVRKQLLLAIIYRRTGEYLLPKGRKDVGERLEQTATRETFEETGYPVTLLQLDVPSLATQPKSELASEHGNEPIAVTQRTTADQVLKIIFWYAAEVDSTTTKVENTQDENEDFETVWISFDEIERLSFKHDQEIAAKVIRSASTPRTAV